MMADYIQTLLEARNGQIAADINRKFGDLLAGIRETGKAGKITVVLAVKPSRVKDFQVAEVAISHDCKIAKPEQDIGEAVFFVTPDGGLTRSDPEQQEMFEEVVVQVVKEEQKNG